jgi:hypothetical protein
MASRPQQKPEPAPSQPGLKVVEKPAPSGPAGQSEPEAKNARAEDRTREAQAAARRRLHPPRIWPD